MFHSTKEFNPALRVTTASGQVTVNTVDIVRGKLIGGQNIVLKDVLPKLLSVRYISKNGGKAEFSSEECIVHHLNDVSFKTGSYLSKPVHIYICLYHWLRKQHVSLARKYKQYHLLLHKM